MNPSFFIHSSQEDYKTNLVSLLFMERIEFVFLFWIEFVILFILRERETSLFFCLLLLEIIQKKGGEDDELSK